MFGLGHWEVLLILLVIVLIFGAKRIPEMAKGVGKGIKEFRKALSEDGEGEPPTEDQQDEAAKEEKKDGV